MGVDFFTEEGALRLKRKIEEYWNQQGKDVQIHLVRGEFVAALRSGRTDIRSNMKNGYPVSSVKDDLK